ncbi:protein-L-isoaspartate O-methyltransferase [Curvibacter sp. APW13]|uniref:protein-L-isoaspartate O-methyltransferase family protein n=1 Tax=Curvibacter sp. APW13 TaxID=3077236 RepID=UPI0028DEB08D|nr:protein-L-isoaspartate O-methyltransferase [Curvibacter sp. APW13]MDT8991837.1 protein-L-isoaspartate O-methyltransferase [Curvibacter sp. APW13]
MAEIQKARFNMVEQQVRPWNVSDEALLALLLSVPRDAFVPAGNEGMAFADIELPTACGERMLAPKVQAKLVQELRLQKTDRVLEIGTGTGYMTALLANLAERVVSLEQHAELVTQAQNNLAKVGIRNAQVRQGDGAKGAAVDGPYDAIVLAGSVAEVPQALLDQLQTGGRLVAIVGDEPIMRCELYTRTGTSTFTKATPWDCNAPRLHHFPTPSRFSF